MFNKASTTNPAKYKGVFTNKPQNKNGDTDTLDVENRQ